MHTSDGDHPQGGGDTRPNAFGDRTELATALTMRRHRLGLTVRQIARAMQTPSATVGGYFSGRHLPASTRPEVVEALLEALAVPQEDRLAWVEAFAAVRRRTQS